MNPGYQVNLAIMSEKEKRKIYDYMLEMRQYIIENYPKENSPLTQREQQILRALAKGKTRGKVAIDLHIAADTVKTHISNIFKKLKVGNKDEAIKLATEKKYI